MTAPESSPWAAARSHSHALLHLPWRNSRLSCFAFGGGDLVGLRVGCRCSQFWLSRSAPTSRVVQVQFFCEWADARMTSVEHVGMLADASVSYAQAGLGWGLGYFLRENQALATTTATDPGRIVPSPAVDTCRVQVPAGFLSAALRPIAIVITLTAPNALHSPSLTPVHHSPAAAIICWDSSPVPVSNIAASQHGFVNHPDQFSLKCKTPSS